MKKLILLTLSFLMLAGLQAQNIQDSVIKIGVQAANGFIATLPQDVKKLHYSLYRVSFDPQTGDVGPQETVWDASQRKGSVCHPKASPDGRWLLYTVADYGTFPIWHRECDLEMMNLLKSS